MSNRNNNTDKKQRKSLTELFASIPAKVFWGALLLVFLMFAVVSFANQSSQSDSSRTKAISQQLRCLECEGLSVYESDTQTSKTIVKDVSRRVKEGQSDSKIFSYYESIYGEFIRLSPTSDNGNWVIYLFPAFGALVLVISIFLSVNPKVSSKIKYGFWSATVIIALIGLGIFVSDSKDISTEEKKNVTQTTTDNNDVDALQKLADNNPTNENLRNLGIVQFANDDYINALKNLDAASKLDANDAKSRGYASYIVMLSGEYELALTRAQEAVAIDPNEPVALFFRGVIYFSIPQGNALYSTNNKALADKDFDEVLRLAPDSGFAEQIKNLRS